MFNKTRPDGARLDVDGIPPMPETAPQRPTNPTAASVPSRGHSTLQSDLQFHGNISGAGDLQVDGAVKGDLKVGRLIVGETGAVEGNITADYAEVRGRVVGSVTGKQVKMMATAYVEGDVTAEQLSIDIGAFFQGRVLQSRREAAQPAPRPAPVAAPPAPEAPAAPKPDARPAA